jgi:hypothetical protein
MKKSKLIAMLSVPILTLGLAGCVSPVKTSDVITKNTHSLPTTRLATEWNPKNHGISRLNENNFKYQVDNIILEGKLWNVMTNYLAQPGELDWMLADPTTSVVTYNVQGELQSLTPDKVYIPTQSKKANGSNYSKFALDNTGKYGVQVKRHDLDLKSNAQLGLVKTSQKDIDFSPILSLRVNGRDYFTPVDNTLKNDRLNNTIIPYEGSSYIFETNGTMSISRTDGQFFPFKPNNYSNYTNRATHTLQVTNTLKTIGTGTPQ